MREEIFFGFSSAFKKERRAPLEASIQSPSHFDDTRGTSEPISLEDAIVLRRKKHFNLPGSPRLRPRARCWTALVPSASEEWLQWT